MALSAPIAAASSGDNTIVAGVAGKRIRVTSWSLSAAGAVNAKWKDGASTDKSGLFTLAAAGSQARDDPPDGRGFLFECADGNSLVLNLSGAVAVGGVLRYVFLPSAGFRGP